MTAIELAPEVAQDFQRILAHLKTFKVEKPQQRMQEIIRAIDILGHSPLIGRPIESGLRELVIGRRTHGYIALYRYISEIDTVFILAIRSQSEAGYAERDGY